MPIKKLLKVPVREKFDWKQLPDGRWRMSLGVRGCRVRVAQRKAGGDFVAISWIGGRRVQVSLRTNVRSEARARAEAFMLKLHEQDRAPERPLTLGRLWDLYREGSGGYRSNTTRTRKDKAASARRLFTFFGETRRVQLLTRNDVERYLVTRSTGSGWPGGQVSEPVRTRTAADDLCLLRAMVRWAMAERKPDETWLLQDNPLRGVKLPKEENPRRPVISFDRYEKMLAAAQELAATSKKEASRTRWVRFEMALVLAEATGVRIGSILGLRWCDIDYRQETIRWDPEFHKRRREVIVDLPPELAAQLRSFRAQLGALGNAWLFPRKNLDAPWPREVFRQLWVRAEAHAGLPHIKGAGWHTLRRKWAIERKHLPPVDVAGAGGWKDLAVLQTIYQIPTPKGMREVMRYQGKLREQPLVAAD